ncbi:uncharacterized protein LOC108481870 [Gossypium arboreum]|uniref:uncharacterized protein LOC108481870 n=1 Tax=Gossypium arboreum TaxID=29729 RepID=UPI00081934E2|nr:uncharacterized protein LOC108481870 [Gossypium arboreum]
MHPGGNKMYRDLQELYWRLGLKREVTDFVPRCLTYQQIAPYEALYGHNCRTPLYWIELSERRILGPKFVSKTEDKVLLIRDQLKVAYDRQKSYADLERREIEYSVGDFVFLKVSPWKKHIIPVKEIKVHPDLTFEEEQVQILDCNPKVLRRKSIPLVKVL